MEEEEEEKQEEERRRSRSRSRRRREEHFSMKMTFPASFAVKTHSQAVTSLPQRSARVAFAST